MGFHSEEIVLHQRLGCRRIPGFKAELCMVRHALLLPARGCSLLCSEQSHLDPLHRRLPQAFSGESLKSVRLRLFSLFFDKELI